MSQKTASSTEEFSPEIADLPEGWVSVKLGDIISPSKEKTEPKERKDSPYLSLEHIEQNTGRIIGCGKGSDVGSTKAVFRSGDVLYGKLRPYLNKVCIPEYDGICSTDILVFPKAAHLKQLYLMRFLMQNSVVEYAHHHSSGVQLPRISFEKMADMEFPLPPLPEQKRIVAKVEELFARVNMARQRLAKVPKLLKRFRQAVLDAACSGRLTEEWREAKGNPDVSTEELPSSWRKRDLEQLCTDFQYGTSQKSQKEGRVAVLRMGNIQDGKIDWSDLVFTDDDKEIAKLRLSPNTVLFNRTNSPELVGKTALYRGERPAIFAGYLIRIINGPDLDPVFLHLVLNAPAFKEYCMEVKTDGVSQSNINAQKLAAYIINWCPVAEQKEIVRRVQALFTLADKIETRVQAATARVEKITQSILAKAFKGELVPTEAELARQEGRIYETAQELLERIRVEREKDIPHIKPRAKS